MGDEVPETFLFETSTHVLWAEEVALEAGIPVAVVPAPAETRDTCGLAIQTYSTSARPFSDLLEEEEIPFKRYP
jgi:hypothetical protein